ncbi:MAG: hypothetical protein KDA93_09010 [Planctomycetaceae bacterium]|nr:hypothetical protein [Planctomycetaceae bacterium]
MITLIRWAARALGMLIVGMVVVMAVGQGVDPTKFNGIELGMLISLLAALVGMVALWWREGIGGAISLAGMIAFNGLNFAASGKFPGGPVFPVCFLPGVLSLICAYVGRARSNSAGSDQPVGEQPGQNQISARPQDCEERDITQ